MNFCHLQGIFSTTIGKTLLNTATKTGLDALEIASEKAFHKTVEATGELIGNKMAEKPLKPKAVLAVNSRNVSYTKRRSAKGIRKMLLKKTLQNSKLLKDSTTTSICNKKGIEVNDLLKNISFQVPCEKSNKS